MSDNDEIIPGEDGVYRDSSGAFSVSREGDNYTPVTRVAPPAMAAPSGAPMAAPAAAPTGESEAGTGKGRKTRSRRKRSAQADTAAEPTDETADAELEDVDGERVDDGWLPGGGTTTAAGDQPTEAAPAGDADGGRVDEKKDDDGGPSVGTVALGYLTLGVVGGGIILVNTVSGAVLLASGAGLVVATGAGVAGYRSVKNRIKNRGSNRQGGDPWSLLPFQSRTARRAQRKAAKRAAKGAALGLGLPVPSGRAGRRAGAIAGGPGRRKAASRTARSGGLPKATSSRKGLGLPKSKGGAGLGLPKSKGGKALGRSGGPGRRTRSGAGIGKVTGPGHTKSTAAKSGSKTPTGPKGKSGKRSTTPQANVTTTPKGRVTHTKAARKAKAHVASMPHTSPLLRRRLNRLSPNTRAELRRDLHNADGLRPGRRRKLEHSINRADQRHERTANEPWGAKRAGRTFDEVLGVGLYGAFLGGRTAYRAARAGWTYTTPHRVFTEAKAREFWRDTHAAFRTTDPQSWDPSANDQWREWVKSTLFGHSDPTEEDRRRHRARQAWSARNEERLRARAREQQRRKDAWERWAAANPIRVKATVGEPVREPRQRPARPQPHPVAGTRSPLPLGVKPARRVAPPPLAIESTDAFDVDRDTDHPDTRGKVDAPRPAARVAPPRFTDEEQPSMSGTKTSAASARTTYVPHPAHQPLIAANGQLFSVMPGGTLAMYKHLLALGGMWTECATDIDHGGAIVEKAYPLQPGMHSFYRAFAQTYHGLAQGAYQTAQAFKDANDKDMQRSTNPHPNEEWGDVPEVGEDGVDMGPFLKHFRNAHMDTWRYQPQNPLDLLEWFLGLYPTYLTISKQIDPSMPLARFPGAGLELHQYWGKLSDTWLSVAGHSATLGEKYQRDDHYIISRFTSPRPNENLANAGRRNR